MLSSTGALFKYYMLGVYKKKPDIFSGIHWHVFNLETSPFQKILDREGLGGYCHPYVKTDGTWSF